MRLLFDQNLSFRLCSVLADLFPDSEQAARAGLSQADDLAIWRYARAGGFMIVTQDADFADISLFYKTGPKVLWLRCGNRPTRFVADLLRRRSELILAFAADETAVCLELL